MLNALRKHVEKNISSPKDSKQSQETKTMFIPRQLLKLGYKLLPLHVAGGIRLCSEAPSATRTELMVVWPDAPASFPAVS